MKMYFEYLKKVLLHKYYVFIECCKLGIPWLGIIHDLSKFLPCEFFAYARYFHGSNPRSAENKPAFDVAWLHHQKSNKHHWQYWILQYDNAERYFIQQTSEDSPMILALGRKQLFRAFVPIHEDDDALYSVVYRRLRDVRDELNTKPVVIEMPRKYALEMVADWRGAGRAYESDKYNDSNTVRWYTERRDSIMLHDKTRELLEKLLGV